MCQILDKCSLTDANHTAFCIYIISIFLQNFDDLNAVTPKSVWLCTRTKQLPQAFWADTKSQIWLKGGGI